MLSPFVPHITEELWRGAIDENTSVHDQSWPEYSEEAMKVDNVEIVLQVNGKVRGRLTIPAAATKEELEKIALADANVVDMDSEYNPQTDKVSIAKAAICVLKKLIVLTSDSLGKSSQGYNVEMLRQRIKDLCSQNGLDASEFVEIPSVTDGSNMW